MFVIAISLEYEGNVVMSVMEGMLPVGIMKKVNTESGLFGDREIFCSRKGDAVLQLLMEGAR
jgi:hypothetical protein